MIGKLLRGNLVLRRIITTWSGFHLQSCPRKDSVAIPAQPWWTREWGHITSPDHSKLNQLLCFISWLKLTTFLHLCRCLPMFFSFNTPSFHLPYTYRGFLLLSSTGICIQEELRHSTLREPGMERSKHSVLLSCTLTKGGFVGMLKMTVEGAEIRETLPRQWMNEKSRFQERIISHFEVRPLG